MCQEGCKPAGLKGWPAPLEEHKVIELTIWGSLRVALAASPERKRSDTQMQPSSPLALNYCTLAPLLPHLSLQDI